MKKMDKYLRMSQPKLGSGRGLRTKTSRGQATQGEEKEEGNRPADEMDHQEDEDQDEDDQGAVCEEDFKTRAGTRQLQLPNSNFQASSSQLQLPKNPINNNWLHYHI